MARMSAHRGRAPSRPVAAATIARLMADRPADLLLTDPPYGVDYGEKNEYLTAAGRQNRSERIVSDDLTGDALGEWKCEGEASEAVCVAPKVYGLRMKDGELKMASKGTALLKICWAACCMKNITTTCPPNSASHTIRCALGSLKTSLVPPADS
jgi:hypothetical protein